MSGTRWPRRAVSARMDVAVVGSIGGVLSRITAIRSLLQRADEVTP